MDRVASLKKEIELLAAENMAVQYVLTCLLQRLGEVSPELRVPIVQAFDDAANHAENFSLRFGRASGHIPETLRIIEQMRTIVVGKNKPTGLV